MLSVLRTVRGAIARDSERVRTYMCCMAPQLLKNDESPFPSEGGDYGFSIEPVPVRYGKGVLREIGSEAHSMGFVSSSLFSSICYQSFLQKFPSVAYFSQVEAYCVDDRLAPEEAAIL